VSLLRLLLAILLLAGCHDAPRLAALPAGSQVLAFGNSITFGSGAGPGEDYPSRLAASSGWQVHNAGVPGDTAENAGERIRGAGRDAAGTGDRRDRRQRFPAQASRSGGQGRSARARHAIKAAGAQVVLVAVPKLSLIGAVTGKLPDAKSTPNWPAKKSCRWSTAFWPILSDTELKADPIHPNATATASWRKALPTSCAQAGLLNKP
jgi:acyl-CoA thioesterase-1